MLSLTFIKLTVTNNCDNLFSLNDALKYGELWRKEHAVFVVRCVNDVFGDTDFVDDGIGENYVSVQKESSAIDSDWLAHT